MTETNTVAVWKKYLAWVARIVVGGTFVVSGFAKCIDPLGTFYKIEDYMNVWGINMMHVLEVTGAFGLSMLEFVLGALLLLGSYRRVVPWLLCAVMAVMLPLTLYIWLADPVADCGCFGDMFVISNQATFIKNIILSVFVAVLILYNRLIPSIVRIELQWVGCALSVAYSFVIAFIGYNYQPLIDFRPYPAGTSLSAADSGVSSSDIEYLFVYEKDGEQVTFSIDSLPDDTWDFVRRAPASDKEDNAGNDRHSDFILYDEDGEDVTDSAIETDGDQLLVLIPDASAIGYSRAHLIRSFNKAMESRGGAMTVVLAGDADHSWRDHIGGGLDVLMADDTSIKELARGDIALVYLTSGVIQWKLNVGTLPTDYLDSANFKSAYPLGRLAINSVKWLWGLNMLYMCSLIVLVTLPWLLIQIFIAKKHKNM